MKELTRGIRRQEHALAILLDRAAESGQPVLTLRATLPKSVAGINVQEEDDQRPTLVVVEYEGGSHAVKDRLLAAILLSIARAYAAPQVREVLEMEEGRVSLTWGRGWMHTAIEGRSVSGLAEKREIKLPPLLYSRGSQQ